MGFLSWLLTGDDGHDSRQQKIDEWDRQQREDELEEEYDEIDGIEDCDY